MIRYFNNFCSFSLGLLFCFSSMPGIAQNNSGYKKPPKEIAEIIDHAINRKVILSGRAKYMAILEAPAYPSLKEIDKNYLQLAGLRIDAENYGNANTNFFKSLVIKSVDSDEEFTLAGIPKEVNIADFTFSPDESKVAFSVTRANETQLWIGDLQTKQARRLTNFKLNNTFGKPYEWAPDGINILAKFVSEDKRSVNQFPTSPVIMESLGNKTSSRSYVNLLKNAKDVELFEYYLTAQVKMVYLDGQAVNFYRPSIFKDFDFSPDGKMVMISTIDKPYSFTVPIALFAYQTNIVDRYGKMVKKLAEVPVADNLPAGFDAVVTGPRAYQWRTDEPQTYIWVEAQDGGDPSKRVSVKDMVYMQNLSSNRTTELAQCYLRFNKIEWGDDQIALITERWFKTRAERRVFIKPGNPSYRVNLWDRYYEDAYSDPGEFVKIKNQYNRDVLLMEYNPLRRVADPNNVNIFSISEGASGIGNRPFLLQFNVKTKLTDTLFRSKAPFYEKPIYFDNKSKFIFSRESVVEPTNYFSAEEVNKKIKQLTYFPNPNPQLFAITKQQIRYQRNDALNLNANLYLPKNYNISQGRLPVLIWAKPKEYKTSAAAAEIKKSPYQFTNFTWNSPVYWTTQGFAVIDNANMPVIGESNEEPYDSFIEQITADAIALVGKVTAMGIADDKKIAIGGDGYGAMVATNLLAHTDLFATGIARNGVYNEVLNPYGFEAEERNYWQNPDLYYKISPFSFANKIKEPLLILHGEKDENEATPTMQSERFYNALKGQGGTSRLVVFPSESHTYKAKESVLHMLWEMDNWLKTYVKNKNGNISANSLNNSKK